MIVEFSIANTFSINEQQTVSFEAVDGCTGDARAGDIHCIQIAGQRLLKLACIYGANASGKTNILTALRFYVRFAADSFTALKPQESTHFVPFCFDEQSAHEPGFFNLVFYLQNADGLYTRYNYELLLCATHVVKEKLSAANVSTAASARYRLIYERLDDGRVKWGSGVVGAKKLIADMTRPNCTVLSTAAQAQQPLFSELYSYLSKRFGGSGVSGIAGSQNQLSAFTLKRIEDDAAYKEKVIGLFNASDIAPISDIKIETQVLSDEYISQLPADMQETFAVQPERAKSRRALFVHKYDGREYELPVGLESAGTLRMLELIAPLSDVIKSHALILIDELEMSLHEELVETFLRLFLETSTDSQLLFTTHNQDLLDCGLLRDDEIWFCYKTDSGNSVYNAITDYAGISAEPSRKKLYQAGKFGALPVVDMSALMELFSAKKDC